MYAKLFASLYQGTLRGQSDEILVFTNLLAHSDANGNVDKHFRAISEETGLGIDRVKVAIENLESPDPESRSPEMDGARIVRLDEHRVWGWWIVNHGKYRNIRDESDRREQNRKAQARWREKQRHEHGETVSNSKQEMLTRKQSKPRKPKSAHTEAEAEAEAENTSNVILLPVSKEGMQGERAKDGQDKPAPASGKSKKVQTADDIIAEFEQDETYKEINVRNQWGRMAAWCRTNHKHPTKRRFINWLNRVDVPIKGESEPQMSAMNAACSNRYAVKDYKITDKKPNAKNGTTAHQPTHQPSNSANGSSFY